MSFTFFARETWYEDCFNYYRDFILQWGKTLDYSNVYENNQMLKYTCKIFKAQSLEI